MTRWVDCGTHGRQEWQRHIMCATCRKIYQSPAGDPFRFPADCSCGARLAPGKFVDGKEVAFTGRPICDRCAREHRPQ